MEDFLGEDLELYTLEKGVATLDTAKEIDFQVGFVDNMLMTKLLAYFATQQLMDVIKKRV
ncbi:ribosome biogenesis protein RLP24-like [Gossypium australe]|uniref:Ribosome biogenesis protein RLP24-like n=1 Tax=Gossypium australe TaxID=47621 RepID=A0A5B6VSP4_9ROSI|nr:ribosome biogenesis protein RLP24-like [Gossypium australe]